MKRALAVLSLLALTGCAAFDPAAALRAAAQELRFSLDKVSPRVELAFPLDQSRLVLDLDLGVQNDSGEHLRTHAVGGALNLATGGADHGLGTVAFPEGLDIAAQGRSNLHAQVGLSYSQVREAWSAIRSSVVDHQPATWSLDGTAHVDVLGFDVAVPFRTSKGTGR
ncbi:MAG TPA: hypothetical protein VFF76_04375 [Holophagaceae bacterium]|jgi:hypothetical protein|nr:hypothetical protein [Holophagaceae bacterium]